MKNEVCCSQLSIYFKRHMAFRKADVQWIILAEDWNVIGKFKLCFDVNLVVPSPDNLFYNF
jgi:hypothetical protein